MEATQCNIAGSFPKRERTPRCCDAMEPALNQRIMDLRNTQQGPQNGTLQWGMSFKTMGHRQGHGAGQCD